MTTIERDPEYESFDSKDRTLRFFFETMRATFDGDERKAVRWVAERRYLSESEVRESLTRTEDAGFTRRWREKNEREHAEAQVFEVVRADLAAVAMVRSRFGSLATQTWPG